MRSLVASLKVLSLVCASGCYRDLAALECEGASPPAQCASETSETSGTGETGDAAGASTEFEADTSTSASDTTSTGVAEDSTSSTDTGETTNLDTSTGAEIFCGDGAVDVGEECDDGNSIADDGCRLCKRDRVVFVSSEPGFIGGKLQGLKGADNYCVSRAAQAKFANFLKFKAFLSDSNTDAVDRLFAGEGRYVLVDGTVVADSWQALLGEPLQHPIELTELGELAHVPVWTGTRYGDGRAVPGSLHCDDWTSEDPGKQANFGWSDEVDVNWTQSEVFNPDSCLSMNAIYCIEQH